MHREPRLEVDVEKEDRERRREDGGGGKGDSEAVPAPDPLREGVRTATGGHYTGCRLTASPLERLLRPLRAISFRHSATAAGIYFSVAFGFLGTLFVARQLTPEEFGLFSIVIVTTGFFQSLLDLTAEEALVKYGFDFTAAESWGKLRRLFGQALLIKAAGGCSRGSCSSRSRRWRTRSSARAGLTVPFLDRGAAALLQSPEGVASAALILRERYDVRGGLLAHVDGAAHDRPRRSARISASTRRSSGS